MKSRVEKEIANAALAGDANAEALLVKALSAFRRTRAELDTLVYQSLSGKNKRATYTSIGLPYGARCEIDLRSRTLPTVGGSGTRPAPLVRFYTRTGHMAATQDLATAAHMLAGRLRGKVGATVKVLLGIERARKRLFELAEEATRWQ